MFCLVRVPTAGNTIGNTVESGGHMSSSTPEACVARVRVGDNIIHAEGVLVECM